MRLDHLDRRLIVYLRNAPYFILLDIWKHDRPDDAVGEFLGVEHAPLRVLHDHRQPIATSQKMLVQVELGVAPDVLLQAFPVCHAGAGDSHGDQRDVLEPLRAGQMTVPNRLRDAELVHVDAREHHGRAGMQGLGSVTGEYPLGCVVLPVQRGGERLAHRHQVCGPVHAIRLAPRPEAKRVRISDDGRVYADFLVRFADGSLGRGFALLHLAAGDGPFARVIPLRAAANQQHAAILGHEKDAGGNDHGLILIATPFFRALQRARQSFSASPSSSSSSPAPSSARRCASARDCSRIRCASALRLR